MNGSNTYNNSGTITGSRFETNFESGTRYRFRLINTAADTHFKFSINNHTLEVIANDSVPIVPYTTNYVSISMGQRYDVIVTANKAADNYWLRAIAQTACSNNDSPTNINGIVRYDSSSTTDPSSTAFADAATQEVCADEASSSLVPYVAIAASDSADETDDFSVAITPGTNGAALWEMCTHSFIRQWNYPTVLQAYEGNDTWSAAQEVYQFPDANIFVYLIVQTTLGVPHPMHLHGHDFWVLGKDTGVYDASTANLTFANAPRRDVVLLPGSGWVVIAFKTDNPGVCTAVVTLYACCSDSKIKAWLMHCHIAWYTSEGLAVQVLERESEMVALIDGDSLNSTCQAWDTYTTEDAVVQDDSGI